MTRQEQKEARRQAILMKALELFVTKGYYETKINDIAEGESDMFGIDFNECQESVINSYYDDYNRKNRIISDIIQKNINDMKCFVNEAKRFTLPKNPDEERQNRILSFPWCIAGNLLSIIKFLK